MKRQSLAALGLIVALCAVVIVALWPSERVSHGATPNADTASPAPTPEVAGEPPTAPVAERVATDAPPASTSPASASDGTPAAAHEEPAVLELRGSLIVLDADGRERAVPAASFELTAWRGNAGQNLDVHVVDGKWSLELEEAQGLTGLSFDDCRVANERATFELPAERIAPPADGWIELRARLPRSISLRVLAGDTGADLSGLMLVRPEPFPESDDVHPGLDYDARIAAREQRSPVDLDPLFAARDGYVQPTVLVGCEGYAWALAALDIERGGERVVTLARAGGLELRLNGADAESHAQLRLRPVTPDAKPCLSQDLGARDQLVLDGLAPGAYWVRVEVGDWFKQPLVLGELQAVISAGAITAATLTLTNAPRLEHVAGGGIVWLPAAWGEERPLVTMELLDTPLAGFDDHQMAHGAERESDREGYQRFEWSMPKLQPGRYELGLHEPPFTIVVELPREGRTDFELVVPPPVEVSVSVVDADTGDDLAVENIHWNAARPPGVTGGGVELAERDPRTGRYEFRAPAGKLELSTWDWRFTTAREEIEAVAPRTEHTLRLRPACGFVLRLKDGDTVVPIPRDWYGSPEAVGGEGRCGMTSHDPLGRRYCVTAPGTYALEMPAVSGYRPLARQTVVVPQGTFVDFDVQLEREQP